jgi:hypothetical protein
MTRDSVTVHPDGLLSPQQVESEYEIAQQTLANWRWKRIGPEYVKTAPGKGGRVKYRRTAIEKWLDNHTVQTASG